MPKPESPAVVIIYTPHIDGVALMTGCKKHGKRWMYTKFQMIGETEVQAFIDHYTPCVQFTPPDNVPTHLPTVPCYQSTRLAPARTHNLWPGRVARWCLAHCQLPC